MTDIDLGATVTASQPGSGVSRETFASKGNAFELRGVTVRDPA